MVSEKGFNIFITKTIYNLLGLIGFLSILFSAYYFGYMFRENQDYFSQDNQEIKLVNYINSKYTYNFLETNKSIYSIELGKRIKTITYTFMFVGLLIMEYFNRKNNKLKYRTSFKTRLNKFWNKLKNSGDL